MSVSRRKPVDDRVGQAFGAKPALLLRVARQGASAVSAQFVWLDDGQGGHSHPSETMSRPIERAATVDSRMMLI
jgi:hypothetical protein